MSRGCNCILQGAKRARTNRTRTGIAVESGHTNHLAAAGIDISLDKSFDMGIVQEGGIELNQPALGGQMPFQPIEHFSQGRYTPYKY